MRVKFIFIFLQVLNLVGTVHFYLPMNDHLLVCLTKRALKEVASWLNLKTTIYLLEYVVTYFYILHHDWMKYVRENFLSK